LRQIALPTLFGMRLAIEQVRPPAHQSTLDAFLRSRLEELRGGLPSAGDSRARAARRRLIADVYEALRHARSPGGLSADCIACELVRSDSKGLAAPSSVGRSSSGAAAQLEPWIEAALRALEETGHVYRAGTDESFLASISDRRLDEKDLDDLLELAYCSSNLWTIAALADVQRESARQASCEGRDMSEANGEDPDAPEALDERGTQRANKRKLTAIGGAAQLYTTTHEIHAKREVQDSCPWGWRGGRSLHQYVSVGRECTGKLACGATHRLWSAALCSTGKAILCSSTMGQTPRPQHGSGPWPSCMEFSSSGEYLLCARTDGNLAVFKSSSISHRMCKTWDEAGALAPLIPVRDVRGLRSVDCVHWNPANRNELGTSSRSNSDIHIFDMKVCGIASSRGPQHSRNTPTTIFSQSSSPHANGSVLEFAFVPSAPSMMIAGTSSGAVVVWDARSPKTSKGVMKQEDGGVCYLQVLRDGCSVVAGTANGAVHVWDIRAARASMAVMSIGGRSPDKPLFSAHVQQQLPVLNADNDIVPGSLAATTDDSHLRTYSLEPVHEVELAFAFGHRTVGVLNLLSGVYPLPPPPAPPLKCCYTCRKHRRIPAGNTLHA